MNHARVLIGGIVGGIVFNVVSIAFNFGIQMKRYLILQDQGAMHREPRVPFLPLWMLTLFLVSIGLVWLYAAARPRLGPGPRTALCVGLVVGLIGALPGNLCVFSWTHVGGFVSLFWEIEMIVGCAAATLAGGWVYKE